MVYGGGMNKEFAYNNMKFNVFIKPNEQSGASSLLAFFKGAQASKARRSQTLPWREDEGEHHSSEG